MKITILQGAFFPVPPVRGGAVEKMWFELGREFARRGHHVVHVSRSFGEFPQREILHGVRHARVRGADRGGTMIRHLAQDLFYTWRAARSLPRADIVVTNTFWAPILVRRKFGALYVDVQRMPKGQMRLYRRASRLRAPSSAVQAAIAAEAPALASRVRVIPNPLPFQPTRPVNWGDKTPTVLFAGRLHPEKGIELLLEAWRVARDAGRLDGWRLELVGPTKASEGGGGEMWVNALRARYPQTDIIWRPPVYEPAELNALYERAALFVYPSLAAKGETFGLAVLEAMAWGAVPVVSDLACFRDFVMPGGNGFIFDHTAADATGALATAMEHAARTGTRDVAQRAIAVRETHACTAIADQFLLDFSELLSGEAAAATRAMAGS